MELRLQEKRGPNVKVGDLFPEGVYYLAHFDIV